MRETQDVRDYSAAFDRLYHTMIESSIGMSRLQEIFTKYARARAMAASDMSNEVISIHLDESRNSDISLEYTFEDLYNGE